MTVDLAGYVGALPDEAAYVAACLAEATALVEAYITGAGVPDVIRDRMITECGADLYNRQHSRNGLVALDNTEVGPVRINRDPMASARPLAAAWVIGIA